MLPIANTALIGPKVLPVVLAVGGATVAGSYARSRSRTFDQFSGTSSTVQSEPVQAGPVQNDFQEPQSRFFYLVLESIFA
ncbi:hypothetical protein BGZ63DRAFT_373190 [Mariannaea sp. PMI_226]|nr:hypothetical protein BGZ63DRAFT_373190 [Mariannaea sp. PMI_226]